MHLWRNLWRKSFIQHDVENENENEQFKKKKKIKEELKEIKSLNWFDENKFKEILAIIDNNEFNYKNRIGEFKYIDIKDLVNNIKNNTISEIDAKKSLNALNKIKNAEIKYKRLIPKQKELLNLFNNLLDTILTDKTLMSSKEENEKLNENEKLKEENENEKENENESENENEDDDYKNEDDGEIMKGLNDVLDEKTGRSKSFEG